LGGWWLLRASLIAAAVLALLGGDLSSAKAAVVKRINDGVVAKISYAPNSYVIGNAYPRWTDFVQGPAQFDQGPGNPVGKFYRWGFLVGENFNFCAWIEEGTATGSEETSNRCGSPQQHDTGFFAHTFTNGDYTAPELGDGETAYMNYNNPGCNDWFGYGNVAPWRVPATPTNRLPNPVPGNHQLKRRYVSRDGAWTLVRDPEPPTSSTPLPNWYFIKTTCITRGTPPSPPPPPPPWVPANGDLVQTPDGAIYRLAGGAPLHITDCAPLPGGCTSIHPIPGLTGFADHPADGTLIAAAETSTMYRIAGGAPLTLSDCAALPDKCPTWQWVNAATLWSDTAHLRDHPADGTFLAAAGGAMYRVAGGAPLWIADCGSLNGCAGYVWVNTFTITNDTLHLRDHPADGTLLQGLPSSTYWTINGGRRSPTRPPQPNAIGVNDATLDQFPIQG
jgi:hypothetical protein